jgi:signal transduction histidine kinase
MIHLKKKKSMIVLEVEDDGCGFDPKTADKAGMGLRIMQERAAKVDGKLKIKSIPGKGTKVIVTVGKERISQAIKKRESNG